MENERYQQTATSDRLDLPVTSERYWANFTSPQTVSQCDCFTVRPFFAATYVHVFVVWNFTRLITRLESFFNSIWLGALSSNVFTICALYWSLGRRGYFGVSNVVLVFQNDWFLWNSVQFYSCYIKINSSPPGAAYMRQWMGSTLVQIKACRLFGWVIGLLSIGPLGTNFNKILIELQNFSFMIMHLKILSVKWRPFCPRGMGSAA